MKRKFTKYPSNYVKANSEPHIVEDNEIVDIYLADGSSEGYPEDSFYMKASTQYGDVVIHCKQGNYPSRYDYVYVMESDDTTSYEHFIGRVLKEFFNRYKVNPEDRREILQFAAQY